MDKKEIFLLYIATSYSSPYKLSKARLVKMLYLADWKNCLVTGKQLSDIKWYFNHYGPYVMELQKLIEKSMYFKIESVMEEIGRKEFIVAKSDINMGKFFNEMSDEEKNVLNFVVEKTKKLNWNSFIKLVYSTYPVLKHRKYTYFDLETLSQEYLKMKQASAIKS